MTRVTEVTGKVLAKAKARLVDMGKNWKVGVTKGIAWDMEGSAIGGNGYTACHAWLTHMFNAHCWGKRLVYNSHSEPPYKKDAINFLTLSCHSKVRSKGICSVEAHEAIILWMASEDCPFHQHIINRDDKESLLNGGVIILCGPDGATCAQAMWMCKVLRYAVEGSQALDTWLTLKEAGMDAILALLVATSVRTVTGARFGYTGPEGHSTVFSRDQDLPYQPEALLLRRINQGASQTADVFCRKGFEKTTKTPFMGFCKSVPVDDGWGGKISTQAATKAEFIRQAMAWEAELRLKLVKKGIDEERAVVRKKKPKRPVKPARDAVFLEVDM